MPAWSPDGAQIAFVSPSPVTNQPILYVVNADGLGDPRIILGQSYSEAHRPVWSPDGDVILFDLGLEGTLGGRQLSAGRDVDFSSVLTAAHNPAFSPDGHWVVCEGGGGAAGWDIFVMSLTGEEISALTDDAADEYQPAWRP
jgi:tricorn protease-like protein